MFKNGVRIWGIPQIQEIPQFAVEISLEFLSLQEPHTLYTTLWLYALVFIQIAFSPNKKQLFVPLSQLKSRKKIDTPWSNNYYENGDILRSWNIS